MAGIETLYVVNHSHTDIGFTDYQGVCFRQHREFVDGALDLVEATADYPEGSRYRWTCEVTGPLLRWLRLASPPAARALPALARGRCDRRRRHAVQPHAAPERRAALPQPVPAAHLREEYGLTVRTAMQCDVNGVSWLFADLLAAAGIELLTMAVNEVRGRAPRPMPAAFRWQGPAGGSVLAWNGFHYLFGRSIAKLGDWRFVDRALPPILSRLADADDYPFDFLWCQSTHPMRVDNWTSRPAHGGLRAALERRGANAADRVLHSDGARGPAGGRRPPDAARRLDRLVVRRRRLERYETGVNRSTHELLLAAETIGAWLTAEGRGSWDPERVAAAYEQATLYDEHTWGAFASIAAPTSLFTRAQWSRKSSFAYEASMETHDVLARTARELADSRAERGIEGRFNLGELTDEEAYPRAEGIELLVVNTLPWPRTVVVEEPDLRGGGAPVGMLEQFFPPNVPWGGALPHVETRRVLAELPGFGYAFVSPEVAAPSHDLAAEPNRIENAHYRVEIDPQTGALASWVDKELDHDFAGEHRGWRLGEYVYERVDGGRDALFAMDFSRDDFGVWQVDPPFRYGTSTAVRVADPVDPRGPRVDRRRDRGRRRSRCPRSVPARDWTPLARHRVAAREGARHRPRVRLRRVSVRPGRAPLPARPERRPLLAERAPAERRRSRLVPRSPLDRRQRRRARGYRRSARCAARATRRDHDREGSPGPAPGGSGRDVVGAEQPLDGQLQGEPGR